MSRKLKKKAVLMVIIEIVSVVLLGIFLTAMQADLTIKSQKADTKEKLKQITEVINSGEETRAQTTESYDVIYQSKVRSLVFMSEKEAGFACTNAKMAELAELLRVTNIAVLDKEGNIVATAKEPVADFTYDRYNQLREVFGTKETAQPMEVTTGEESYRYYAAALDDEQMVVIEQDPEELYRLLEDTSTWKGELSNISVGMSGYAMAVSSKNYTFLYHPDEEMVEEDALSAGVKVEDLEKNNYVWMTINGERLYCGVDQVEDAYIICAVPRDEIAASRAMTVGIVLFIFFAVMTILILYAILLMYEEEKKESKNEKDYKECGGFYYHKTLGRKIGTIAALGMIVILVISLYMQTLFSLSRQSMSSNQRAAEVQKTIDRNNENVEFITELYNTRYLNKCRTVAYILSSNPELINKEDLAELSEIVDVLAVNVFDSKGVQIETNSVYTNFVLAQDPEEQSYAFRKLLEGGDYLIQEALPDEVSGELRQYIGVTLRDDNGDADGFVQIAITPDKLEAALKNTGIAPLLDGIKVGARGFAFAVNKKDKTFAYYPKERLIGKNAQKYGMKKIQFGDEYCDYIKIGAQKYYASSLETDNYYIYVAVPEEEMMDNRIPITAATGIVSFLFLLLVFVILTFSRKDTEVKEQGAEGDDEDSPMIDIVMPDGSVKRTESAASRWANISIKWDDKTPEQQVFSVLRGIFAVLALFICAAALFKDSLLHEDSILLYVLEGTWQKGMNIFAITGSVMIICVVSVISMALRKLLSVLSRTFGARGETVCRLMSSFVKYISVLAMLYYVLALFGVDTKTLLASAGILSLVVGLGAKELISDILAGLFIIFEGEFRVGDIVTVGDWRGTVIEIGIRTTKIEDPSKNIKIISNSQVSGVINMTRRYSFAFADVGIEYGESLERVENILEKELPAIKKRVPAIQDGPFYKGVVELGQSSVNIRVMAQCAEGDRVQVGRDLNREMKLLFDKYDINIPFPQVVLNQPSEFIKATEYEKWRAERFNKTQKELSKNLGNEEEEH